MENNFPSLEEEIKKYFAIIQQRIIEIFQEAIQKTVYDYTDPLKKNSKDWYERTGQFKDSVNIKFEGSKLIAFIDTSKFHYKSWVSFNDTDDDVSRLVPWLLEEGHHYSGDSPQYGFYKNFNGRGYLEMAQTMIKEEFPDLLIKIVNDEPSSS